MTEILTEEELKKLEDQCNKIGKSTEIYSTHFHYGKVQELLHTVRVTQKALGFACLIAAKNNEEPREADEIEEFCLDQALNALGEN